MRPTLRFFAYLCVCLLIAGLLTPLLVAPGWIAVEPHRLMGRLAQLLILIGLWPFLAWQGLAQRAALGYEIGRSALGYALVGGWILGVLMLGALFLVLLILGIRVPDPESGEGLAILGLGLKALGAGLMIALLEESFFRGALYTAIRQEEGVGAAVIWSSGLYAAVHFLKPSALPDAVAFDTSRALWMIAYVFIDLWQWKNLDSGIALFLAGLLLAWIRERAGHLGWCIGIHAGWVFVIQLGRGLTDGNPEATWGWLVGSYDGVIGWLAALWIGGLSLLAWFLGHPGIAKS